MVLISWRNGRPWSGMTTQTLADLGDRRFVLLENCYLSPDGGEIRTAPGWKTVYDFVTTDRSTEAGSGYVRNVVEKATPVVDAALIGNRSRWSTLAEYTRLHEVWSRPVHFFGFKRLRGRLYVFGEDDFRREPIYASYPGTELKVVGWATGTTGTITLSGTPLLTGVGNPANSLDGESIVWISGDDMPTELRDKMHRVISFTGAVVTLDTEIVTAAPGSPTDGTIGRVRVGQAYRGIEYPISQYDSLATQDRKSLVAWVSTDRAEAGIVQTQCWPSYVMNRQPDSGDSGSLGPRNEGSQSSMNVGNFASAAGTNVTTNFAGTLPANTLNGWIIFAQPGGAEPTPTYGVIVSHTAAPNPVFTVSAWSNGVPGDVARTLNARTVGFSRRKQKRLPYRPNPDATSDRILLGAPGYGCAFEIPATTPNDPEVNNVLNGLPVRSNDLLDKPRCIGVPKGQMWVDVDTTVATGQNFYATQGGGGPATRPNASYAFPVGTYKFRVAYRDDATGETGLASEPVVLTTTGANQGIRLFVMHPGYLMAESAALTLLIYRTVAGGETYYLDVEATMEPYSYIAPVVLPVANSNLTIKYGISPLAHTAIASWNRFPQPFGLLAQLDCKVISDAVLATRPTLDALVQMPAPAGVIRTTRGITFYANRHGNAGFAQEMVRGTFTTSYDGGSSYPNFNELTIRNTWDQTSSLNPLEGLWGLANPGIPHGYQALGLSLVSSTAFPYPFLEIRLAGPVNSTAADPAVAIAFEQDYHRWTVQTPYNNQGDFWDSATYTRGQPGYFNLPRGRFQWSPVGRAWQTPAVNLGYADAEGDEDIEAIGPFGGGVLLSTRTNTYSNSFIGEPRVTPDFVSGEFGCIAPNTMVEFDGGTAWISERGPVAYGPGGMNWIGRDLEQDFVGARSRYLRDSTGRMRHAFGYHDKERGLVCFGLFANRNGGSSDQVVVVDDNESYVWQTASDELRSRWPCDEILVWSYRANAWSRWSIPAGMEWMWAEPDTDAGGTGRIEFLTRDGRIYLLDDGYVDSNTDPIAAVASNSGTDSNGPINFPGGTFGDTLTARGSGDNLVRNSQSVVIVRNGNIVGLTYVAGYTTSSLNVFPLVSWQAGDTVYVGSRIQRLQTCWVPTGDLGHNLRRLILRYSLSSKRTNGEEAAAESPAFIRCEVMASRRWNDPDGESQHIVSAVTIPDEDFPLGYTQLGRSVDMTETASHSIELANGIASGAMLSLNITLIGPAQIHVHDILMETM